MLWLALVAAGLNGSPAPLLELHDSNASNLVQQLPEFIAVKPLLKRVRKHKATHSSATVAAAAHAVVAIALRAPPVIVPPARDGFRLTRAA
jgi:hypothetical protein